MWTPYSRRLLIAVRNPAHAKVTATVCNVSDTVLRRFLQTDVASETLTNTISKISPTPSVPNYVSSSASGQRVSVCHDTRCVIFEENDKKYSYPFVWLRDNCQCEMCFHDASKSRVVNWDLFDITMEPLDDSSVKIDFHNDELSIEWRDRHKTVLKLDWLRQRNFLESTQKQFLSETYRPDKSLWGKKDFSRVLATFSYAGVMNNDDELREWLEALTIYGVTIIKGAPTSKQVTRKIAERIGHIKKTHYGEEFAVKARDNSVNVAYLSTQLQMHTDLPYYEYKPGANLLHCLVQSQSFGGRNLLTDGFHVANRMRKEQPENYEMLSKTLVNWSDLGTENGNEFHKHLRMPVICEGRDGVLERINHSIPQRDSHFTVPLEKVQPWYEALDAFIRMLNEEASHFKTQPGDVLTFDNVRLVHGRTAYTDNTANTRHLVGGYVDWDEIYSRLRVLREKHKMHTIKGSASK